MSIIPPLPERRRSLRGAVTSVIMLLGLQMEREYIRVATVDPATGERRQPNVFTDPTSNAAFLSPSCRARATSSWQTTRRSSSPSIPAMPAISLSR